MKLDGKTQIVNGGLVFLSEQIASSSATLDFALPSTYDEFVIEIFNLRPATNGQLAQAQFSTNGGSSYDTTTSNYITGFSFSAMNTTSVSGFSATTVAGIMLCGGVASGTQPYLSGTVRVRNPSAAVWRDGEGHVVIASNDGNFYSEVIGGFWKSTTAATNVRIMFASGAITSGTIRIYGVAKS